MLTSDCISKTVSVPFSSEQTITLLQYQGFSFAQVVTVLVNLGVSFTPFPLCTVGLSSYSDVCCICFKL